MTFDFFSTGRYALVDVFYRHIWFNTYNLDICHSIRRVFEPNIGMLVFDLESFPGYHSELIDSTVCLNWQIVNNDMERIKHLLKDKNITDNTHRYTDDNFRLINVPADYPLPAIRCKEIQYQIYVYKNFSEQFENTTDPVNASIIMSELGKIFQSEIHMDTIESKVYRLAEEYLNISPLLSGKILTFLNKNYE
jgi:hypothetical protein